MSMTGWSVSLISLVMTGIAPLSTLPKKLSASSRMISLRCPLPVSRYSPESEKVLNLDPRMAMFSMASPVRWSEAFISTTDQPISIANASAEVVFPIPGVPISTTALFSGMPFSQDSAQSFNELTAPGLPMTSSSVLGRYFSVQSITTHLSERRCRHP